MLEVSQVLQRIQNLWLIADSTDFGIEDFKLLLQTIFV